MNGLCYWYKIMREHENESKNDDIFALKKSNKLTDIIY